MNFPYSELREQLINVARLLFQAGVMSHSGPGGAGGEAPCRGRGGVPRRSFFFLH